MLVDSRLHCHVGSHPVGAAHIRPVGAHLCIKSLCDLGVRAPCAANMATCESKADPTSMPASCGPKSHPSLWCACMCVAHEGWDLSPADMLFHWRPGSLRERHIRLHFVFLLHALFLRCSPRRAVGVWPRHHALIHLIWIFTCSDPLSALPHRLELHHE